MAAFAKDVDALLAAAEAHYYASPVRSPHIFREVALTVFAVQVRFVTVTTRYFSAHSHIAESRSARLAYLFG